MSVFDHQLSFSEKRKQRKEKRKYTTTIHIHKEQGEYWQLWQQVLNRGQIIQWYSKNGGKYPFIWDTYPRTGIAMQTFKLFIFQLGNVASNRRYLYSTGQFPLHERYQDPPLSTIVCYYSVRVNNTKNYWQRDILCTERKCYACLL